MELRERAARLIPGASQTISKGPTQWSQTVLPAYLRRAEGGHVWDVDGNRYLDFPMALGPVILGHSHPAVTKGIATQLEDGITFTLPHPLEIEVAERIVARVPGAEMVRFVKTGSESTSAAIRLARAHTGRDRIVVGGYHGWHDWYIGATSRGLGVPEDVRQLTTTFDFNDLESLDAALAEHPGETAAVILEPAAEHDPDPGFLEGVIARAHQAGALAIFDEVITGFRLAPGGAQERYGVTADLVTFGKALGNGMPISAVAGPANLMSELARVFVSGTHGGEALSLAAAKATLDALDDQAYEVLFAHGERLRAGVQAAIDRLDLGEWVSIDGAAPRTVVLIREAATPGSSLPAKSLVQQEMAKRGVLFNGSNFICLAHSDEDIAQGIHAYEAALEVLADALPDRVGDFLEGEPIQSVFGRP
jgi:glutamate-1-semialdehyde aminotransferase